MDKYLRWGSDNEDRYSIFNYADIDEWEEMEAGESVIDDLAEELNCEMNSDYSDLVELADNLHGAGYPIVSNELKAAILEEVNSDDVEFVPIKVINHKGRTEAQEYSVLNALRVVDCINFDASEVVWNPLDPECVMHAKGLVLDESKIPADSKLFRLKGWGSVILLTSDLATKLVGSKFSGLYFPSASGYSGSG